MTTYFLAIAADGPMQSSMTSLVAELEQALPAASAVRWVNPGGMHITVRYLGAVDDLDGVIAALPAVIAQVPAFTVTVEGLGAFPDLADPAVLWAGVTSGRPELAELHDEIEQVVLGLGLRADRRSFAPHLTLGFVPGGADKAAIGSSLEALRDTTEIRYGTLQIDEVVLYASDPGPSGSVHTPVDQFPLAPARPARFVIQEHYATTHHFDFRLERDATLWSWAVPKGMPTHPKRNRLAVRVEDHDLDHIDFEDLTPVEGEPPGTVRKSIWDSGTYEIVRETEDKLVVDLTGTRLRGRYSIFRTGGTQWMLHLMVELRDSASAGTKAD